MRNTEIEARLARAIELLRKGLDTTAVAQRLGITPKRLNGLLHRHGHTAQGLRAEVQP